jgi:hypothetical protein
MSTAEAYWTGKPAIRYTKYMPQAALPWQHAALWCDNLELLAGGAAGPGKSSYMLLAALQYVDVPGYAAIIFRRSYPELARPGGLMARSQEWLANTDAHWDGQEKQWKFPSGATLNFGYLQAEFDKYKYSGSEFYFCVARGTGVLMADDSIREIQTLKVGELVATLEGPRRIKRVIPPSRKPCLRVSTPSGEVYVSLAHKLLTPHGWESPASILSKLSRASRYTFSKSERSRLTIPSPNHDLPLDCQPTTLLDARSELETRPQESDVLSANARTGCATFDDYSQETQPLLLSSVQLTLLSRLLPSSILDKPLCCGDGCERPLSQSPNLKASCSHDFDLYDVRSRLSLGNAEVHTLLPSDVEEQHHNETSGDPLLVRKCNHFHSSSHVHPYTKEAMDLVEETRPVHCNMDQAGVEMEVWDLEVESSSHYIVSNGVISSNCGFDELTTFKVEDYQFLFSRLRKPSTGPLSEIPLRMRSTSNPGGPGHLWVRNRFMSSSATEHNRLFIPAKLSDNPHVDQKSYVDALSELDDQTRRQLLDGDWNARPSGNWMLEHKHIEACVELGRRWKEDYENLIYHGKDEFPEPAGGEIALGIDWGEHTQGYVIWPLEKGGVYIPSSETVQFQGEPAEFAEKIVQRAMYTGWPVGEARYDAAGIQSMRTFARSVREHPQWGLQDMRTIKIPFSTYKYETIQYMRWLAERSYKAVKNSKNPVGVLAIDPDNETLIEQLLQWQRKDAESDQAVKTNDHGPDSIIAGVAPIARRHRSRIDAVAQEALSV